MLINDFLIFLTDLGILETWQICFIACLSAYAKLTPHRNIKNQVLLLNTEKTLS